MRRLFASLALAVLLCVGLSFSPPPDPVTYYVNQLADPGGDGTTQELTGAHCAFQTIAAAQAAVTGDQHGNSLLIARGTPAPVYREQYTCPAYGTAAGQFTFGAYGTGANPIINGSDIVSTWTAEGTPNVWQAVLTTDPGAVFFDGTPGVEVASVALCNGTNKWYWESNTLYVYSTSDPDTAYTNPGIEASIRNYCLFTNSMDYIVFEKLHTEKAIACNIFLNGPNQSDANYCLSLNVVAANGCGVRLQTVGSKAQNCVIYGNYVGLYSPCAAALTNSILWNNTVNDLWAGTVVKTTNIIEEDADENPLFVSEVTPDFHLLPTSPCINAGTDVGLTTDYAGTRVPQGPKPDIGAYERLRRTFLLFLDRSLTWQ